MNKIIIALTIFLCTTHGLTAQDTLSKIAEKKSFNPRVEGMSRSKGFTILYERTLDSRITSESNDTLIGNGNANIRRNNKLDIKLKLPIINRDRLKIVLGLKYFFEEFNFETPAGLEYALYKNLDNKNLKTIGVNLNILNPLNETSYLGFRVGADLNGDYSTKESPTSSYLKYYLLSLYGWKKSPTQTTALGIFYGYTFGRRSIFPVVLHNSTFNSKWGLETFLPFYVKMRHNFSEKTLLYLGIELDGASYNLNIDNPSFLNYPSLELRRSNIRFQAEFEQEIHDWLWFGIIAGIRQAFSLNLAKEGSARRDDNLIENKLQIAPYFNVSIFIVAPKNWEGNN